LGAKLPPEPDAGALDAFLVNRKAADPVHYEDLSLSVLKLMGPGEYVRSRPGGDAQGHFGLAAHDYTHSTAPNRRFADLVTQRLVKALTAARAGALHRRRAGRYREQLYVEGRRRAQGAAQHVEAHSGGGAAQRVGQTFSAVVHGRNAQRRVRARARSAGGRPR